MFGTAGPMARSAADLGLLLSVLAEPRAAAQPAGRIAVYEEDGLQPVSRACREAVRRAAAALSDLGFDVVEDRAATARRSARGLRPDPRA